MARPGLAQRELQRAREHQRLLDHLTVDEEIRLAARQHWIVLAEPLFTALAVSVGATWLFLNMPVRLADRGPSVLFLVALAAWLRFGWRWLVRRHDLFVATDKRILKYQGLIITDVPMMRLSKVTDMRYTKPVLGELLDYGTVVIESAGQDQAIREIAYLPDPLENYQRLCEVIFGDKHRPRRSRTRKDWRRRLERLARRRSVDREIDEQPEGPDPDILDGGPDGRDGRDPIRTPGLPVPRHEPAPAAAAPTPVTLYESEDRKARRRSADTQAIRLFPTDDPPA